MVDVHCNSTTTHTEFSVVSTAKWLREPSTIQRYTYVYFLLFSFSLRSVLRSAPSSLPTHCDGVFYFRSGFLCCSLLPSAGIEQHGELYKETHRESKNVRIVGVSRTNQKPKWWTTVKVLDTRQDFCRAIVNLRAPHSTVRPQVSWVPGHTERCRRVAQAVWAAGRLVTLYIILPVFCVCPDWTILMFSSLVYIEGRRSIAS
jgi:hypothetical protein